MKMYNVIVGQKNRKCDGDQPLSQNERKLKRQKQSERNKDRGNARSKENKMPSGWGWYY